MQYAPSCSCSAGPGVIELNSEFEVTKISEYLDISNWAHHIPYILPQVSSSVTTVHQEGYRTCSSPPTQGRTTWWNPVQKAEDEFEDEEEEEDREQPEEPEPETGPPILTSAAEDNSEGEGTRTRV